MRKPCAEGVLNLPDFIIIGAMKSGTTTLMAQLQKQKGIFMSEPKEPCFFSNDEEFEKGVEYYSSLFSTAPEGALLGEASTNYSKLPTYPLTVSRIKEVNPNCKFIYIMRHPMGRLISHYSHDWIIGEANTGINKYIHKNEDLINYSLYHMQLEPYLREFGKDNILPVFLNRLSKHPQQEFERICKFIGYSGKPRWYRNILENASSGKMRKTGILKVVRGRPRLLRLVKLFFPRKLRKWINRNFYIERKPKLTKSNMRLVNKKLDEDLNKLGKLFGVKIDCKTFKSVTTNKPLEWI